VASRADHRCQADGCGIRITSGGEVDHKIAIINGGENRESNLQLLCRNHHKAKSRADVALKSKAAKTQRAMGPLRRDEPKMKFSKRFDGTVTKWNPATKRYEPLST
jgi:5-methylcytosine-specific restriction protein A